MATCRQRGETWEFKIQAKAILGKPRYITFDTKEEGLRTCAYFEAQLRQGILPPELADLVITDYQTIADVIRDYTSKVSITEEDESLLGAIMERCGQTKVSQFTYGWTEAWISDLKPRITIRSSR